MQKTGGGFGNELRLGEVAFLSQGHVTLVHTYMRFWPMKEIVERLRVTVEDKCSA